MSITIRDGTGSSREAKIDSDFRLATSAVVSTRLAQVSRQDAGAFIISTGFIPLTTTGSFTGVLYIKYTGTKRMFIYNARASSVLTTEWLFHANPTGGTLISGAVAGNATNPNLSSAEIFPGLVYKGANGNTVTGGVSLGQYMSPSGGTVILPHEGVIILSVNDSVALSCKPSAATDVGATLALAIE